jgi:hypothetical protein
MAHTICGAGPGKTLHHVILMPRAFSFWDSTRCSCYRDADLRTDAPGKVRSNAESAVAFPEFGNLSSGAWMECVRVFYCRFKFVDSPQKTRRPIRKHGWPTSCLRAFAQLVQIELRAARRIPNARWDELNQDSSVAIMHKTTSMICSARSLAHACPPAPLSEGCARQRRARFPRVNFGLPSASSPLPPSRNG